VRERVAADLIARSAERALRQYVAVLAREAKVEGIDLSAAGSPLVQ